MLILNDVEENSRFCFVVSMAVPLLIHVPLFALLHVFVFLASSLLFAHACSLGH